MKLLQNLGMMWTHTPWLTSMRQISTVLLFFCVSKLPENKLFYVMFLVWLSLISSRIRASIFSVTGCRCSAGVARSVMLARLATKAAKPDGCFVLDSRAPSAQVCIMLCIMTPFGLHFHNIDLGMRHIFWCLPLIAISLIFNTSGLFKYVTCIFFRFKFFWILDQSEIYLALGQNCSFWPSNNGLGWPRAHSSNWSRNQGVYTMLPWVIVWII